jgi:hypothetical protein
MVYVKQRSRGSATVKPSIDTSFATDIMVL